jgi:membrane protein implicated in regulation of membrane protease activity
MILEQTDYNTIVIVLGIILIIAEIALGAITGFELFVIGVICIIAGLVGMMTGSFALVIITIAVLSFLYLAVARQYIKKKLTIATRQTNADSLIGETGHVVKKIAADKAGQIKVDGEVWRAEADTDIAENKDVIIESISGVTLKVKKQ